jgi:hypothetical protein|tara:strand:- start:407 stop:622 length:216 start_codon:yes stop_codon:yes gene_type:complete
MRAVHVKGLRGDPRCTVPTKIQAKTVAVSLQYWEGRRPHSCVEPISMCQQERGAFASKVMEDAMFAVVAVK